jgi:cellulose synthase/poly-beta-1,6-N-acetylglucosamine synthase-like glycosyltransferase
MTKQMDDEERRGVSIIACTNKVYFMENIFENYSNLEWNMKELIIILNNNRLKIEEWIKKAEQFQNVTIFQLPEDVSLGNCLNYGISKAKYEYIAKFDDDDYYAPAYLKEAMNSFINNVQIVGKRTYYLYFENKSELFLRFPNRENRKIKMVHGGTIVAKREVFEKVPFPDLSHGEDKQFFKKCVAAGIRIYSTSRYNYTYFRRNPLFHTWKPDLGYLFRTSKKIAITTDFKKYADPKWQS